MTNQVILSPLQENEIRIRKDYRTLSITTIEQSIFMVVARYLADHPACTYRIALHMKTDCHHIRPKLRRMEKMGYVIAESNGSNNIVWSLTK